MEINRESIHTNTLSIDQDINLDELDEIAGRIQNALRPAKPDPEFRARLRDGLHMAASHREMNHLLVRQRTERPWGLLVGAAALGSAAGLIAILLRGRQGSHAEVATIRESA
jgi:hypothetical protein